MSVKREVCEKINTEFFTEYGVTVDDAFVIYFTYNKKTNVAFIHKYAIDSNNIAEDDILVFNVTSPIARDKISKMYGKYSKDVEHVFDYGVGMALSLETKEGFNIML